MKPMVNEDIAGYEMLNIGCGPDHDKCLPEPWLNIDKAGGAADFISDARSLPANWSNSFSEVRASHILEHFFLNELPPVVREWARVLAPGGVLRIIVPDLAVIAEALIAGQDSKGRPSTSIHETTAVLAQIYGVGYDDPDCDPRWRHRIVFDERMLCELLESEESLFDVQRYEQAEDPARSAGIWDDSQNRFSLCVRATKRG